MPVQRKRRRRRGGYHTGVHLSHKAAGPCKYRSGWELLLMKWFDDQPSVTSYGYETVVIPYVSNVRTRRMRNYLPDFIVQMADGTRVLVEVKPSKRVSQPKVQKKLAAARDWCAVNQVTLHVITEHDLKALGLL